MKDNTFLKKYTKSLLEYLNKTQSSKQMAVPTFSFKFNSDYSGKMMTNYDATAQFFNSNDWHII